MNIKILNTPEYKKGSSRAKWFAAIKRYDGKDVEALVAATTRKRPVHQVRRGRTASGMDTLL